MILPSATTASTRASHFLSPGGVHHVRTIVAMVWEGKGAIALCRNVIGATSPANAAIGTIRGDLVWTSAATSCTAPTGPRAPKEKSISSSPKTNSSKTGAAPSTMDCEQPVEAKVGK